MICSLYSVPRLFQGWKGSSDLKSACCFFRGFWFGLQNSYSERRRYTQKTLNYFLKKECLLHLGEVNIQSPDDFDLLVYGPFSIRQKKDIFPQGEVEVSKSLELWEALEPCLRVFFF